MPTKSVSRKSSKSSMMMKSKKTKKGRVQCSKPIPKGYGCCFTCRKNSKIMSSEIKKTKNGRKQQVSLGECGHKMYKFVKN
jgi:hypothetical protein